MHARLKPIKAHESFDFCSLQVQCEFCKIEIPFSVLDQHHSECSECLVTCEKGCPIMPLPRKNLPDHYQVCPAILVPCSMAQFGCVEQIKRGLLAEHVLKCGPRYASSIAELVLSLQKQVTELSARVDAQQDRVQYVESTLYPCDGQFTWRIDAIREKIKAAQAGDAAASVVYSPSFYSSESGYKICLCVYPAGDNHEGYLSLYFVLMKGQFDEVLQWPFHNRVVLSLLSCRYRSSVYPHTQAHTYTHTYPPPPHTHLPTHAHTHTSSPIYSQTHFPLTHTHTPPLHTFTQHLPPHTHTHSRTHTHTP